MDEEQKAAVCCQVGKTWSRCMLSVGICYSPNQINIPRYSYQEITVKERRMRGQAQKEQRADRSMLPGWKNVATVYAVCWDLL
jgi:hypothetical protein